jgi:hypothetical protein
VDSEGELGIRIGRLLIQLALLQSLAGMPEAGAEGKLFICVPEGEEELADFVSPLSRGADDAQRRGGFRVAGLDALQ